MKEWHYVKDILSHTTDNKDSNCIKWVQFRKKRTLHRVQHHLAKSGATIKAKFMYKISHPWNQTNNWDIVKENSLYTTINQALRSITKFDLSSRDPALKTFYIIDSFENNLHLHKPWLIVIKTSLFQVLVIDGW